MNNYMDQELAKARDSMPALWWAIYTGCLQVGFNDKQSLTLLQTFIVGQVGGKLMTDPPLGPPYQSE